MRMIPCMAGCAGPTLRSMSRVSCAPGRDAVTGALASGLSGMVCDISIWRHQWLPISERIVLSERMAPEGLVHENGFQIRVAGDWNPEHAPDFAQEPVSACPERRHRMVLGIRLLHWNLHSESM